VPQEAFVAFQHQKDAYGDFPLPIDCQQTISQPYIVAYMTEKLKVRPTDKVLEIGTGSGFQTAVLAQLANEVYTIELHQKLSQKAKNLLTKLGYYNIFYKIGDGKEGWKEQAFFDKIILTAAVKENPSNLLEQLAKGGKMILPLEDKEGSQRLVLIDKIDNEQLKYQKLISVRFVPSL